MKRESERELSHAPLLLGAEGGLDPVDGCRQMWVSVMLLAIRDFSRLGDFPALVKDEWENDAAVWIVDEASTVGSFRFICDVLDVDADRLRNAILAHSKMFTGADLTRFANRGNVGVKPARRDG